MTAWKGCLLSIATVVIHGLLIHTPCFSQQALYNNGPDGEVGYYHINFGAVVTNSFNLPRPATVSNVILTIYAVDDRNVPEHVKWTITTEPFGGTVLGRGFVDLSSLGQPYLTRFLFFGWKMGVPLPNLSLPAGTYYLQLQDVVTRWDSWAFWAQSAGGDSLAYYEAIGQHGAGSGTEIPSESFAVYGRWEEHEAR